MATLRLAALGASALLAAPLLAHGFKTGSIKIGHPWSRETAPSQVVGAGSMTITNSGKTDDRLVSASSSRPSTIKRAKRLRWPNSSG